jgi:SAM-dependent methyltransferase
MQPDFRATLYGQYVTAFKGQSGAQPSTTWWDHKLLPLVADMDRASAVLELGCGDGALLAYLAQRGFTNLAGVDISAEQVALAQRRGLRVE